jgi:hypothetical protein
MIRSLKKRGKPAMFVAALRVEMKLAPVLDEYLPSYKDSFRRFVSGSVQQSLLAPFRVHVRGYKDVTIHGHVLAELATGTII